MKTKKFTQMIIAIFVIAFTISCSKNNSSLLPIASKGTVVLKAKATLNKTVAKSTTSAKNLNGLTISSFIINIKNIEFDRNEEDSSSNHSDLNDDSNLNHNDSIYTNLELQGPFELNLATGATSIDVVNVDIPNNIFDKIEFELHKSTDPQSAIYGKSIEIKGDINGTPFIFWTDAEEEMKINFSAINTNIVVNSSTTTTTTINFDLSAVFGNASTIDFSSAVDGNGDGLIEISPNNIDGNADLADLIKNLLEEGTDLEND
jgi:hypothetical protein